MTRFKLAGTTALALILGQGAFAAVTPAEVWQGWQDAASAMGQKVSADSEEEDGDTLVVKGISISGADGASVMIDTISFTDNGDGTVGIVLPDSYPIQVSVPPQNGEPGPTDLTLDVSMAGAAITASGTPEAVSYKTEAPEVSMTLGEIKTPDGKPVDVTATFKLTGVAATYLVEGAESGKKVTEDFAAKSFDIAVKGTDPESGGTFDMTASAADFGGKFAIDGMPAGEMTDLAAALKAGFALDGSFAYGATKFDINATEASGPTKIAGTLGGGTVTLAMDATRLSYASGSKALSLTITSPDIPIPDVTVSLGESAFNLLMPVSQTGAPADFALLTKIVDLKISDAIWGMIDPTAQLPHDPATLIVDTKGTATLTKDLMTDAAGMENAEPPGEINSLDLTQLDVKIAGAELTGAGAFTFDNTDLETFGGVPAPTGKIDLKVVGLNALVDKLVAMGLVPQDQAMQGRMMLAMFANTSTTADEITSTLEFKDKRFYANGQQLQ